MEQHQLMQIDQPSGVDMVNRRDASQKKPAGWAGWQRAIFACALCIIAQVAFAGTLAPRNFDSPEEGVSALVKSIRSHDVAEMRSILGPDGDKLVNSGDEVADRQNREAFIKSYDQAHKLLPDSDRQVTLVIGENEWPLPIPLVKSDKGWFFDTQQGDDEILARRVGRNELSAVQVLLEIVDSEREYAALNRKDDGIPEYAAKIVSAPGKRDGLYWPTAENEPQSPIGELLAAAANEGYTDANSIQLAPYHGYLYRILTKQGESAKGGEYDYFSGDRMTRGFAAIAYPARYGASGMTTFIVSQDGNVYEKDLGKDTEEVASRITSFNPDPSWRLSKLPDQSVAP
jgi:hypothetical protein